MDGAIAVGEATTMDGVAAIIAIITVGETSLPKIVLEEAAFGRLFLWSQEMEACSARHIACRANAGFASTAA